MAGVKMIPILEGVRNVINKWVNTNTFLTKDATPGDTILHVQSAHRFQEGDQIRIEKRTADGRWQGETPMYVTQVISGTQLRVADPVKFTWEVSLDSSVQKTFDMQTIQGIYLGEPENIPRYPAIVISGKSRSSEFLTIDSTKEEWDCDLTVYTKTSTQEQGYRNNSEITDTAIYGLKRNIYPLVEPFSVYAILSTVKPGDQFIKVSDTSWFEERGQIQRVVIEDEQKQAEIWVYGVIDSTTLRVAPVTGCEFLLKDNPQLRVVERFIYNSWPRNTTYGEVYKGTLLKASKINWFAQEERIWQLKPRDLYMH